jgi:hypothetical protein
MQRASRLIGRPNRRPAHKESSAASGNLPMIEGILRDPGRVWQTRLLALSLPLALYDSKHQSAPIDSASTRSTCSHSSGASASTHPRVQEALCHASWYRRDPLAICIRAFGLRQARYLGEAKTHLQHLITATAINVARLLDWLAEVPRCKTRTSRFAALAA